MTLFHLLTMFHNELSEKLTSFTITADMVKTKLSKLKMNKAPGIDLVTKFYDTN